MLAVPVVHAVVDPWHLPCFFHGRGLWTEATGPTNLLRLKMSAVVTRQGKLQRLADSHRAQKAD